MKPDANVDAEVLCILTSTAYAISFVVAMMVLRMKY